MNNPKTPKEGAKSTFLNSIEGLANVMAFGMTFFLTPALHARTVEWVKSYVYDHYGYGWEDVTSIGWFILTAAFVFFLSRGVVGTLLMIGGIALANRIF